MEERSKLIRKLIRTEEISLEEASILGGIEKANPTLPFKYIIRGNKFLGPKIYSEMRKNIADINSSSGNYVAKLNNFYGDLYKENENLKIGNQNNCPLVKAYGMANVYDATRREFQPAIILEKIEGKILHDIINTKNDKETKKIKKKYKYQISKVEKIFCPNDLSYYNAMLEKHTRKMILLDPESWELK